MPRYDLPTVAPRPTAAPQTAYLISSGDLRESANVAGWPTQAALEAIVIGACGDVGWSVTRANDVDPATGHGFISSQRMGIEVFKRIPADAPLIVAEAVWQYSHHVLGGLRTHRGPVLTVANFEGRWPGLVGLLGLNACLTKIGREYSTIWTVDGSDEWFRDGMREWLETGRIEHNAAHVRDLPELPAGPETELGTALADRLLADKAIIGVFDEGCMGMYNAIIDDELLNPLGIYKERLSQSALWAEMQRVPDDEADDVGAWLAARGMTFDLGTDDRTELTAGQLLWQYKMYVATLRMADGFGLDAVGIQYQQGLKDLAPASDLVEGLLNNVERPPVRSSDGLRILFDGAPLPCFNEVDEGAAVDALVTDGLLKAMGLDRATTLHDIRWGEDFEGRFVWVFEISGSVPPSHFENGYADAVGWRQSPTYFPAGGSTIKGVSKPGPIVWSRLYIAHGRLHLDIGRGDAVRLPDDETQRRWALTNPEWPIMHAVLHGVTRDQLMARHKANHVQVAYAPTGDAADGLLLAKSAAFARLGVDVHLCGTVAIGS
jgi:hypothetical protein